MVTWTWKKQKKKVSHTSSRNFVAYRAVSACALNLSWFETLSLSPLLWVDCCNFRSSVDIALLSLCSSDLVPSPYPLRASGLPSSSIKLCTFQRRKNRVRRGRPIITSEWPDAARVVLSDRYARARVFTSGSTEVRHEIVIQRQTAYFEMCRLCGVITDAINTDS